jgi:hypothetical protein
VRSRKKAASAIIILTILAVAAIFHVYVNLEDSGITALWNDNEAYFFIGTRSIGHRVNLLRFPWFLAKNYLGAIEDQDDLRGSSDAIHVTSSDVEHHVVKIEDRGPGSGADMYTPLENRIYVNYPTLGGLSRWTGDHFESVTQEDRQRLDGINHLTNGDIDHGANGWSKHSFGVEPGNLYSSFTIEVGNDFKLRLNDQPASMGSRTFSIDVLRPGRAPERIWNRNLHWDIVSRAEYQHTFYGGE